MKELTFVNVLSSFNRTAKDFKKLIDSNSSGDSYWKQIITNAITNGKNNDEYAGLRITNVIDKNLYYIVQFTIKEYGKTFKLKHKSKSFWLKKHN